MSRDLIPELENLHARITRILEAFRDADYEFVELALDDLAHDVWQLAESRS